MAKYIIDIPEDTTCVTALRYEDGGCVSARSYITPLTPYVRSESYIDGLKEGQNEVWEFARKMISTSENEVSEMWGCVTNFGEVIHNTTYQEAKAKYDAWKREKKEIHVGDEVKCRDTNCVVVRIDTEDRGVNIVLEDGDTAYIGMENVTKTGRHFDEVEKLLERMENRNE